MPTYPGNTGWQLCKEDATAAPTVNDDSTLGYAKGSRWYDITNNREYVCLNPTTTAAVWKEATRIPSQEIPLPTLITKSASYTKVGDWIWTGSNALRVPKAICAAMWVDAGSTMKARIYDVTNAKVVGEVTGITATYPSIIDFGTLSNIATGSVLWEYQILKTSGGGAESVYGSSVSVRFE